MEVLAADGAWSLARACRVVGVPRSSFYHLRHPRVPHPAGRSRKHCHQPGALSDDERSQVLEVLLADQDSQLSVEQVYWRGLDAGLVGCSLSTFYRIARAHHLVGDRRRGRHSDPAARGRRPKPVVVAEGVNQLWSWDITELPGPGPQRFQLMLAIDVFSRYPVGYRVEASATRDHAVEMFTDAFARHGLPVVLHSDNGAQMRSTEMKNLLGEVVQASFSRPHVSDDNPFSEALFKTIKYDLAMPDQFDDLNHARAWVQQYLTGYATQHRHVGLAHHTPEQVFTGHYEQARLARQRTLDCYYAKHPERFSRPPTAPQLPALVGINLSKAA